ncbi:hypothetical protein [Shinella zoogloeoides]|uniref:hypothetical protein n=1 Tax=Shinella zoogloeoides TaxID=352475 RepID=UPI0028B1DA4B|nr:hypothetical protein [Shinella zoogloeoides]
MFELLGFGPKGWGLPLLQAAGVTIAKPESQGHERATSCGLKFPRLVARVVSEMKQPRRALALQYNHLTRRLNHQTIG